MSDFPNELIPWCENWKEVHERDFFGGEMISELVGAINRALTALGYSQGISPKRGRTNFSRLLGLIPKEHYDGVLTNLLTKQPKEHYNAILSDLLSNKHLSDTDTVHDPSAEEGSAKRPRLVEETEGNNGVNALIVPTLIAL